MTQTVFLQNNVPYVLLLHLWPGLKSWIKEDRSPTKAGGGSGWDEGGGCTRGPLRIAGDKNWARCRSSVWTKAVVTRETLKGTERERERERKVRHKKRWFPFYFLFGLIHFLTANNWRTLTFVKIFSLLFCCNSFFLPTSAYIRLSLPLCRRKNHLFWTEILN